MEVKLIVPKHLQQVLEDPERHKTITAHRRWGKTTYGIKKNTIRGLEIHSSRYFHIFPTYKQAKMVAWDMYMDYLRPLNVILKTNESELSIILKTGSKIELKGSDYPDSLRGVGLHGCIFDEWALQDPAIFTEIIRPALADQCGWSDKLGTPKGKNHMYDDMAKTGFKHLYKASQTGIISTAELKAMKEEMSADEYAQEMECEFLYFSGQIYKEFKKEQHVIKPLVLPDSFEKPIGIDYGLRNPACVLFSKIDYDGNLYICDEYYESGKEVEEISKSIKSKLADPYGVIDPSTDAKTKLKNGLPYSIYQEFLDNGIRVAKAPNQVIGGINLVKQFFTDNRIFIFDRCVNLIRELENYRWKDRRSQDANLPEEPVKVNDHAVDALRYLIASRFSPSIMPEPKVVKMSDEWFEIMEKKQHVGEEVYA